MKAVSQATGVPEGVPALSSRAELALAWLADPGTGDRPAGGNTDRRRRSGPARASSGSVKTRKPGLLRAQTSLPIFFFSSSGKSPEHSA